MRLPAPVPPCAAEHASGAPALSVHAEVAGWTLATLGLHVGFSKCDRGQCRVVRRRIEGCVGSRLARRIAQLDVREQQPPEVNGEEQEEQEDGHDEGELDKALPASAAPPICVGFLVCCLHGSQSGGANLRSPLQYPITGDWSARVVRRPVDHWTVTTGDTSAPGHARFPPALSARYHRLPPQEDQCQCPEPVGDPATPRRSAIGPRGGRARVGPGGRERRPAGPAGRRRPPEVEVERPADPVHGDFASNLAMKLARPYRMAPLAIATALAAELAAEAGDARPRRRSRPADVAPPGFLNLRLRTRRSRRSSRRSWPTRPGWGRVAPVAPRSVNVEFVSANPTGPLHVGNARGAFIGDLLSRVLEAGGQRVTREYYFNDSGGQIRNLGASVAALRRGEPVPEDGYHGDYVEDLAAALPDDVWASATADGADTDGLVGRWAAGRVREGIEASLAALGVRFDVWTSEARLHDEGWVARAVDRLREHGHVYEQDGAVWFRSTAFGDDKDRVIFRSNGEPTYFAADIGYVTEKFSRGFDHLIYVWGADHHGTVARLRNAAEAMGYDRDAVQVLLYSWVRFVRDGEEVSMSKRAGEFITLDDLLAEVGVDAARWFFASRSATTGIDFDIELAKKQSSENPVYYVQYAHARIASILRKAAEAGLAPPAASRVRSPARPRPRWRGRSSVSPRSSRTPSPPRRRTASPPTRPSSRRRSTGSTAMRGSWTRTSPSVRGTARAGRGRTDHARERARAAGDLRARLDVAGRPTARRPWRDRGP